MLSPYRALFARPGTLAFSSAGFLARLPISMLTLGVVLLVSGTGRSYALAGAVAAIATAGSALGGPRLARLVDRHGQARVLRPAAAVHAAAVTVLIVAGSNHAPGPVLLLAAAVAGLSMTSIGSLVRARWSALLAGGSDRDQDRDADRDARRDASLHTAYSLESVLDELIFILGPIAVTLLATTVHPAAGLAAVLAVGPPGAFLLAAQRATEPAVAARPTDGSAAAALASRGLVVVVAVFVALGALFGAFEVVVVAFSSAEGQRGSAGVVLAVYAFGSLLAGLAYGAVRWQVPVRRRFLAGATAMGASGLALPFVEDVATLAVVALIAGLAIAPTLISALDLVQSLAPAERLTEGLAWATTGLSVGLTLGSATSGALVEQVGATDAFWAATAAALAAAGLAWAGAARLRPVAPDASTAPASARG